MASQLTHYLERKGRRLRTQCALHMDVPPCLCRGKEEEIRSEVSKWCQDHDVAFVPLDARELSVISLGRWNANGQTLFTFHPQLQGAHFDREAFLRDNLRGLKEVPESVMGERTFALEEGLNDEKTESIIDFDSLSKDCFIKDGGPTFDPLKISTALRKAIGEKPCVLYLDNLFTLSEDSIELICRKFLRVEHRPDYSRDNIINIIVSIEEGQEVPFYLIQKGIFIAFINNEEEQE